MSENIGEIAGELTTFTYDYRVIGEDINMVIKVPFELQPGRVFKIKTDRYFINGIEHLFDENGDYLESVAKISRV